MKLNLFIRRAVEALGALYPPEEARSMVSRLVEEQMGVKPYEVVLEPELEAAPWLDRSLKRLLDGEPLQYVTGVQYFCGRRFKVSPAVLIPRPETEMLVEEAVKRAKAVAGGLVSGVWGAAGGALESFPAGPRVLDLCTGSGCIAWSVALEVPEAEVTGMDLSEEALELASRQFQESRPQKAADLRTNTAESGVPSPKISEIEDGCPLFLQADVLSGEGMPEGPFDILLANPPYIRESEKASMHRNVLEHEPAMALFVPDEDPLVFYRAIAGHALRLLAPGGWGMVEINEALGRETAAVFEEAGLGEIKIYRDFFGKERFVSFVRQA